MCVWNRAQSRTASFGFVKQKNPKCGQVQPDLPPLPGPPGFSPQKGANIVTHKQHWWVLLRAQWGAICNYLKGSGGGHGEGSGAWLGLFSLDLYQPSGVNSGFPSYILQSLLLYPLLCVSQGYPSFDVSLIPGLQRWGVHLSLCFFSMIKSKDVLCGPTMCETVLGWHRVQGGHCPHPIIMMWMQGTHHLYTQKESSSVSQGPNYGGRKPHSDELSKGFLEKSALKDRKEMGSGHYYYY